VCSGFSNNVFYLLVNFVKNILKVRPDVIHVNAHLYAPLILVLSRIFRRKAKLFFDIRSLTANKRRNNFYFWIAKYFDHTFCLSIEIQNLLSHHRSTILPVGYDATRFYVSSAPKEPICLYYGSIVKKRKVDILMKAVEYAIQLSDACKQYRFVIAGPCPDEEIKRDLISNSYVEYLGNLTIDELSVLARNSQVGLSYIPNEGIFKRNLPMKTVEMLGSGMYVIATKTQGNMQVLKEVSSKVVGGDTVSKFGESIAIGLEYLSDHIVNSAAISNSVQDYTWDNIVESILLPTYREYCI